MKAADLQVGDVIRVPGGAEHPARMTIVDDSTLLTFDNRSEILMRVAVQHFPAYSRPDGFYWAIERDGKQIWPEVLDA